MPFDIYIIRRFELTTQDPKNTQNGRLFATFGHNFAPVDATTKILAPSHTARKIEYIVNFFAFVGVALKIFGTLGKGSGLGHEKSAETSNTKTFILNELG